MKETWFVSTTVDVTC